MFHHGGKVVVTLIFILSTSALRRDTTTARVPLSLRWDRDLRPGGGGRQDPRTGGALQLRGGGAMISCLLRRCIPDPEMPLSTCRPLAFGWEISKCRDCGAEPMHRCASCGSSALHSGAVSDNDEGRCASALLPAVPHEAADSRPGW